MATRMTTKHFTLIAESFKENKPEPENLIANLHWAFMVDTMANKLARTNERFDHGLFKRACGLEWEAIEA